MITLRNVSKIYKTKNSCNLVLDSLNLQITKGEKVGILGRNGAGKSTLIKLISGSELPTSGTVSRQMSVSWPIAFGGAFQGSLTGLDNLKFICRVYGKDYKKSVGFVEDFAELGKYFREPVKHYSSGMRARLAFAISMSVEFDCFLIDEVVAVGDNRFHEKCHSELFDKRNDRSFIIVSHDVNYIREHCEKAYILRDSSLLDFGTVEESIDSYLSN